MRRLLLAAALATACGPTPRAEPTTPRPQKLPPPGSIDPSVPGAAFLAAIATHVQPNWAQFLEDCRLRLPIDHPLNDARLAATLTLAVERDGTLAMTTISGSGNGDFDRAATGVIRDAKIVEAPPAALLSDDDRVYVEWVFARDSRQAGPATARVITRRLPVGEVAERLLAKGELARAAARIAAEPPSQTREAAAALVMIEALREALGGIASARSFAIEAIGRAKVAELAPRLRELLSVTADTELRLAATTALGAIGNPASGVVDKMTALLANDLAFYPRLAIAETAALVALGAKDRAAKIVVDALAVKAPPASALNAHAIVFANAPSPVDGKFADWFAKGDARTRAAVCAAQPAGSSKKGLAVIARGLRDPDATVRGECVDAAGRQTQDTFDKRMRELTKDRDRLVRARAVTVLVAHGVAVPEAAVDPAPEVRAAAVPTLPAATIAKLRDDADPDVRAAVVRARRDPNDTAAMTDPAWQVRLAGIPFAPSLVSFRKDVSPEVATAATIEYAKGRRPRLTGELLVDLAAAPASSAERVRIALAWLLAETR